ncbi:MAG: hypothetical protein ACPLRR_01075, partial [Candidatus Saccharicenans sp.]
MSGKNRIYRRGLGRVSSTGLVFILVIFLSGLLPAGERLGTSQPTKVRPIRDDVGFCWQADSMKILVDYLASQEKEKFDSAGLVAAISPHDDYLYAGRLYYPLFNLIRTKEAVIFGVTHGAVRNEIKGLDSLLIL